MKTKYEVRSMNEAGDYVTVRTFKHFSHAINFATQWKKLGKKPQVVIVDVGRNMVAIRI